MVPNRFGMTAMVDAVVFLAVMMIAVSVTASYVTMGGEESSSSDLLESVSQVKVRLSDLTELEDDSLVSLTDVVALDLIRGTDRSLDYLKTVLSVYSSGRDCRLVVGFNESSVGIGHEPAGNYSYSSKEVFVSAGGTLTMELWLAS